MMQIASESRWPKWLRKKPPTGLPGAVFWLAVWFCLLLALRLLPGMLGTFFSVVQWLVGIALAVTAIPLLFRVVRKHMLWSLRNKLVLTYLLIGLAPVILFVTLVLISSYVAAGQFAIHLADSRLQVKVPDGSRRFIAQVGVDDSTRGRTAAVSFEVWGDGRRLAATPPLKFNQPARELSADLRGVKLIELIARQHGADTAGPVVVTWGEARIE